MTSHKASAHKKLSALYTTWKDASRPVILAGLTASKLGWLDDNYPVKRPAQEHRVGARRVPTPGLPTSAQLSTGRMRSKSFFNG